VSPPNWGCGASLPSLIGALGSRTRVGTGASGQFRVLSGWPLKGNSYHSNMKPVGVYFLFYLVFFPLTVVLGLTAFWVTEIFLTKFRIKNSFTLLLQHLGTGLFFGITCIGYFYFWNILNTWIPLIVIYYVYFSNYGARITKALMPKESLITKIGFGIGLLTSKLIELNALQ
jgi:hypothetical protein